MRHRSNSRVRPAVTYWAPYTAGRWGIADTLRDWIYAHWPALADNPNNTATALGLAAAAAAGDESLGLGGLSSYDLISPYQPADHGELVGDFPWITHNLYLHAAQSGNDTGLATDVWRAIRGAVQASGGSYVACHRRGRAGEWGQQQRLQRGPWHALSRALHHASPRLPLPPAPQVYLGLAWADADGTVHLPATYSPEYPYPTPPGPTNDTNFDLTLFSWGLVSAHGPATQPQTVQCHPYAYLWGPSAHPSRPQ